MTKHAKLSASAAHRWLECPKSVAASELFAKQTSEAAAEGTTAHAYVENEISHLLNVIAEDNYIYNKKRVMQSSYFMQDMPENLETYIGYVMQKVEDASLVRIEQKVDFSKWVPDGFGTADVIIVKDGVLEVIDLKYGIGVGVTAYDNPQTRLYALGALELVKDIEVIEITIFQPRRNSKTSETLTKDELLDWAEAIIKPAADLAYRDKGEFKAGEHCQFCAAKNTCKARADYNLELAKYDFRQPEFLSDEEIADILIKADSFTKWIKDIQEYALRLAITKNIIPDGFELGITKGRRKIENEDQVMADLLKAGYAYQTFVELKGVTALQKLLGKKKFDFLLADYITVPEGKPALKKIGNNQELDD